ncbi:MAG: hypothetical protein JWO36_68 [Myxococcales bacterium]|nr:hypothetical protein [Myxococcales bacterium]
MLLLVAACGRIGFAPVDDAADAGPPDEHSGTRIKLTWVDYDGTRELTGIYDSQRGELCNSEAWADGTTYCLPSDRFFAAYTDASCTQPIGWNPFGPNGFQPKYAEELPLPCASFAHFYPIGAALATSYYLSNGFGGCSGPYPNNNPQVTLYTLGPEISVPTTFASMTVTNTPSTGRLSTHYFETTDGFRMQAALYDTTLAAECSVSTYDQGTACLPANGVTTTFQDSSCTQPEIDVSSSCPMPRYAAALAINQCTTDQPTLYRVGATQSASHYSWNGMTCAPVTAKAGYDYYRFDSAVTVPSVAIQPDTVPGKRIQIRRVVGEGASLRGTNMYDTLFDAQCDAQNASDGTLRCLLGAPSVQKYYSDAACTMSFFGWQALPDPGCSSVAVPAFLQVPSMAGTSVYRTGTRITGPVYTALCVQLPPTSTIYGLGAEITADQLVAGAPGTDP